jgi:hypothetical protein
MTTTKTNTTTTTTTFDRAWTTNPAEALETGRGLVSEPGARAALRARLDIVAGCDSAAAWTLALYGHADPEFVEAVAWQGVSNAGAARVKWAAEADRYRAILATPETPPPPPAPEACEIV